MEQKDYKQEIRDTRVGCLGSSDGKLLAQIAILGRVPKAAYERMAVVNGLIQGEEVPRTPAIEYGDIIEQEVYRSVTSGLDEEEAAKWESNPLWVSKKFSRPHVKLISHPDIVFTDYARRTIHVYEVKTTRRSLIETKDRYRHQLYIHTTLARELVSALKGRWKVHVYLAHYSTAGLDLDTGIYPPFDSSRLTISEVRTKSAVLNIAKAMDAADRFLSTFTEYFPGEEVDASLLPVEVRKEFDHVSSVLAEIKQREEEVAVFKDKLYKFLLDKDIKSIRSDAFTITRVDDSESKTFNSKQFLDDYAAEHPYKVKKLKDKYTKTTKRKGYVNIKLKNN